MTDTGSSTTLPSPAYPVEAPGPGTSSATRGDAVSELPMGAHFNGHREDLGRSRKLRRGMTAAQRVRAKDETWDVRIVGAYMRAGSR